MYSTYNGIDLFHRGSEKGVFLPNERKKFCLIIKSNQEPKGPQCRLNIRNSSKTLTATEIHRYHPFCFLASFSWNRIELSPWSFRFSVIESRLKRTLSLINFRIGRNRRKTSPRTFRLTLSASVFFINIDEDLFVRWDEMRENRTDDISDSRASGFLWTEMCINLKRRF